MTTDQTHETAPASPRRVIKRYSNRKLYDTQGSSYVTLLQIAQMIREGEDVQIIDNATKEDKTDVTLALIISEELRTRPRAIPLSTLKALVRHGGERILSQLRGPIGRFIPNGTAEDEMGEENHIPNFNPEDPMASSTESPRAGFRAALEHWQSHIDERIRAVLPNFAAFRELEQSIKRLSARIDELEKRVGSGPAARDSTGPEAPKTEETGKRDEGDG